MLECTQVKDLEVTNNDFIAKLISDLWSNYHIKHIYRFSEDFELQKFESISMIKLNMANQLVFSMLLK